MTSTLITLVRDDPCAYALIGAVARTHPHSQATSAWQAKVAMQAEGETYSEDQAEQSMRTMEAHGLGYVRQDAGNGDFGFLWAILPIIAYELIRTGQPSIPQGFVRFKVDYGDVDAWPDLLTIHKFKLRPNCTVTLTLPDDLTRNEVKKLKQFLKALAQDDSDDSNDGPAWDFPTASDFAEDDFPEDDAEVDEADFADNSQDSEVGTDEVEETDRFLLPMSVMEGGIGPINHRRSKKKTKKSKKSMMDWSKF